jgi:hypothetical protein
VTKLKTEFTPKQWKGCCGHGCKKCEIAQAYIGKYGRSEGLERLNDDRDAMKKAAKKDGAKSAGKGAKKAQGKKARSKKKAKT